MKGLILVRSYYIASCVFTSKYPKLSQRIQQYVQKNFEMPIVRCCIPQYKLKFFEEKMPGWYRKEWQSLADCAGFQAGDTVYSLCHNCSAILEETRPEVNVRSLWELILSDKSFSYPDFQKQSIFVQDCWRSKDRAAEQEAVRGLLKKMNLQVREMPQNHGETDFCGISLYRPAPVRNLKLAPNRFVKNAVGKFYVYTPEEQTKIMTEYCQPFQGKKIVDYCHYCQEGLELGGADAIHLGAVLFERKLNV